MVFVISTSPSVDSALVPLWVAGKPDGTSGDEISNNNTDDKKQPQIQDPTIVPVAIHSYPTPASVRCDRLLHELGRAAFRGPKMTPSGCLRDPQTMSGA